MLVEAAPPGSDARAIADAIATDEFLRVRAAADRAWAGYDEASRVVDRHRPETSNDDLALAMPTLDRQRRQLTAETLRDLADA